MVYVDVHTHLTHQWFEKDIDQVVKRAKDAGVARIVTNGVNDVSNRACSQLAKKYDIVRAAWGAYPIDALNIPQPGGGMRMNDKFDLNKEIEHWMKHADEFVAVGEVGLDYLYGEDHKAQQKVNFEKCIGVAEKLRKPIIVHTRKAERDCVDMLMSSKIPPHQIILHSCMGRKSVIRDAANHGMCFSIPPIIARLEHFRMVAREANITQLFTETDAPYLGPERGVRNEPANVVGSVKLIAEIKSLETQEVARSMFMSYQRAFE